MKHELPQGFTWRVPTTDDAQAVTDLVIAQDIAEFGEPAFDVQELRPLWKRKNFDLETDAWLVFAPDGSLAGYADMSVGGGLTRLTNISGVHPAYRNRGIEDWILENVELWARARVTDQPILLRHVVNAHEPARVDPMVRWHYQVVRHAWVMRRNLDQPPPEPVVPEGIHFRTFVRGQDEQTVHATIQETFRDLWQHQDVPYDEWATFVFSNDTWTPELSYLAFDGDEIAAASMVMVYPKPHEGWVQQFGVRRPWRKRGLGLALLHTIFGDMYRRGLPRVGLEVDAENPSGALRVYERAGMRVLQEYAEFRKSLPLTELPEGFTLRIPTLPDAQAVTELIGACDRVDYGEADTTVEDVKSDWQRTGVDLDRDVWLIYAADGTLVAHGDPWDSGEFVRLDPFTCVHPEYREQGLEDWLIARVEEWTRTHQGSKTIQWIVNVDQTWWTERFAARAYHTTRHDYVMEIALRTEPPAPQLANGFNIRAYEHGRDDRAVWAALQEGFRDHRGHADMSFEDWGKAFFDHPGWSPELSPVVWDGDEVVAAAMAFDYPTGGWIRSLATRAPWRKHGLGQAMLDWIFERCYARGRTKVGLGVDAESLTGATRLYERAGMHVKSHFVRYEKEII